MDPQYRALAPLLVASAFAGLARWIYDQTHSKNPPLKEITAANGCQTFIRDVGPTHFQSLMPFGQYGKGDVRTHDHFLMSPEACEEKLKGEERQAVFQIPPGLLCPPDCPDSPETAGSRQPMPSTSSVRVDSVTLGARADWNEDRLAINVLKIHHLSKLCDGKEGFWQAWTEVKSARQGDGDMMMFSVIDGHGGAEVSDLVGKVLHPTLAYSIAKHGLDMPDKADLISKTIVALDNDLMRLPLTLLKDHLPDNILSPLLPHPSPVLTHMANLGVPGACLTNVIVDSPHNKLYVSNVGDCRAVAGWWNTTLGAWRCDTLTDFGDGNCFNDVECERMRNEHPESERHDVVCDLGRGPRLLGNGQPSRAMGDEHDKLPQSTQDQLSKHLDMPLSQGLKPCLTPPYLTAEPEMITRDLRPSNGEQLRFIIIATDGLWDLLTSEEAALLVSAHLAQTKGSDVRKGTLPHLHPFLPPPAVRPYPAEDLPGTTPENSKGTWAFRDENAATHLLRNCLGGGDEWHRQRLLSMKDGMVKSLRDDINALVIVFDNGTDQDDTKAGPIA